VRTIQCITDAHITAVFNLTEGSIKSMITYEYTQHNSTITIYTLHQFLLDCC